MHFSLRLRLDVGVVFCFRQQHQPEQQQRGLLVNGITAATEALAAAVTCGTVIALENIQ